MRARRRLCVLLGVYVAVVCVCVFVGTLSHLVSTPVSHVSMKKQTFASPQENAHVSKMFNTVLMTCLFFQDCVIHTTNKCDGPSRTKNFAPQNLLLLAHRVCEFLALVGPVPGRRFHTMTNGSPPCAEPCRPCRRPGCKSVRPSSNM